MAKRIRKPKMPTAMETAKSAMAAKRREAIVSGNMPRAASFRDRKKHANRTACRGRVNAD